MMGGREWGQGGLCEWWERGRGGVNSSAVRSGGS